MNVDICLSPALYKSYAIDRNDYIAVIVDVFRATTTICTAFMNGVKRIIPVATIEEAKEYKQKGYIVGAERNVKQCEFADFGNSPFQYTADKVKDKDVVLTTTNCTHAIDAAQYASQLIIGSFLNINSVADYCTGSVKDVLVVCAGWNDRFNTEDTLFGGALAYLLQNKGYFATSDAVRMSLAMWQEAQNDIACYLKDSEHIKRLAANGMDDSVGYCLTQDKTTIVPRYDKSSKSLIA